MRYVAQSHLASVLSRGPRHERASAGARARWGLLALLIAFAATATPAMADAVMDWNQTSMDVLKAANVLGNPWTRRSAAQSTSAPRAGLRSISSARQPFALQQLSAG